MKEKNKKRVPRKITLIESVLLLIVFVVIMIWTALIAKAPTAMGVLYCAVVCGVYGVLLGHGWEDLFSNVYKVAQTAMPALYFLMLTGFVSAAWIASGTIPYMIYLGLGIIKPAIFLFSAFLMTAVAAMVTGTSWGILTSLGLALGGIATGLGIPLPMAAGAIVSGCFLGDKWSPLSDTPNLAAASTGQNIIKLFTSMIPTAGGGAVIAGIIYLVMGFMLPQSGGASIGEITALREGLAASFQFNILLLIPIIFVFVFAAMKYPALPVLFIGVILGMCEAMIFQGVGFKEITGIVWTGYKSATGNVVIDALLSRGGCMSLAGLVMLLFAAFTFAGLLEKIGVLDTIMEKLLNRVKSQGALVLCNVLTSMATVLLSSSVYVSIILNGRMYDKAYRKMGLDKVCLSRTLSEGAAHYGGLVPWSGGGVLVISTLGVLPWSYVPFAFAAWAGTLLTVIFAYMNIFMPKAEYDENLELVDEGIAA